MKSGYKSNTRNEAPASYPGLPGDAEFVDHVHYVSHWRLGIDQVTSAHSFQCYLHSNAALCSD